MTQTGLPTLEALEALLRSMPAKAIDELKEKLKPVAKVWTSQPGPQTEAYFTEADETLYGGSAGGGKTDLLIGLATTAHQRSLLFRAQSKDLDGLWERLLEVAAPIMMSNDSNKKKLRTSCSRLIEGGHLEKPGSERAWQGRPHDFIGFDEAAQLDELKVEFVIRWLRSTDPKQRKRIVFATNPPIPEIRDGVMVDTGVGDWLLRWFAPWLDPLFPVPATSGELRWCYMVAEGDRLVTIWVDGPGCYDLATGELVEDATQDDIDNGAVTVARSRTFIKSLLKDNVFLKGTGYAEKLSGTAEPLRSMLLLGDFTVRGEDHPYQVIPTQWVLLAQQRWAERRVEFEHRKRIGEPLPQQLVRFADVAQGGMDTTVIADLYTEDYFDELITKPGRLTPDGPAVAALLLAGRKDNSLIGLDGTGGWAGDTMRTMKERHNIDCELVVSSRGSSGWTPDLRFKYANVRTEMWYEFREALNPDSLHQIALPPSTRLRAQLCAPHWFPRGKEMYIESKDDLRIRLGSSTDEADGVIGAWHLREMALTRPGARRRRGGVMDFVERLNGRDPEAILGQPVELDDPLKGW